MLHDVCLLEACVHTHARIVFNAGADVFPSVLADYYLGVWQT